MRIVELGANPAQRGQAIVRIGGQNFRFRTVEAAKQWAAEIEPKLHKLAKKQLTDEELDQGLKRPDTRTVEEQFADDAFTVNPVRQLSKDEQELQHYEARLSEAKRAAREKRAAERGETEVLMLELAHEKKQQEIEAKQQREAFDADPRRMKAVELAYTQYAETMYDQRATYRDVLQAQFNISRAKEELTLDNFKIASSKIASDYASRNIADKQNAMMQQIALANLDWTHTKGFEEAEPPKPAEPSKDTDWRDADLVTDQGRNVREAQLLYEAQLAKIEAMKEQVNNNA